MDFLKDLVRNHDGFVNDFLKDFVKDFIKSSRNKDFLKAFLKDLQRNYDAFVMDFPRDSLIDVFIGRGVHVQKEMPGDLPSFPLIESSLTRRGPRD